MIQFIMAGALTMGAWVIGLFFIQFWRRSGDVLFLYFAAAFWLLSANWLLVALARRDEPQTALYAVRLLAFLLIIAGIWNKNRAQSKS